jgi:hypothetical protein
MKIIPAIWLLFTILFTCFSVYHFCQLNHSYPRFEWEPHEGRPQFYSGTAEENKINLTNFIAQWNEYIYKQNKSSHQLNLIAAISYLITAIMSCIAMFIPGPHNIKDTANYLYEKCTQSKVCSRLFRHINQEENKSKDIRQK